MGDVAEIKDSARIPNTKWSDSGVPYIRASDLSNNDLSGVLFLDENIYEEYRKQTGSPKQGDVIFNGGGEIGKSMLKLDNRPIYVQGGAVLYVQTSKSFLLEGEYLNTYFATPGAKKYMEVASAGGTMKHFTLGPSKEMPIMYPKTDEQEKIGKYFQNLDHLITLHQRKLKLLNQLKQAYLKQMFPQNGEKVPRLRFANFSGNWERCELGEVVEITMGQSPDSANYTDNPEDNILVQGNADMKNGRVVPRVWTTQVTKTAKKSDLILSVRAPVGDVGKTDYDVVLGRGVAGIKGNEFIYQLLSKMKSDSYWRKLSTGSTFESITSNDIKNAHVKLPKAEEQDLIGNFFSNIDTIITLYQKKLDNLKQIKTTYLKSMFI